jgi:transposase
MKPLKTAKDKQDSTENSMNPPVVSPSPPAIDCEVAPRARRRKFSAADKRRILLAADRCTKPGEIGALMRREGVYSSSLSVWRRQREEADSAALAPQKRGPKSNPEREDARAITQLTRERDSLQAQLTKANLVIEVQKKVASLLALFTTDNKHENT